MLEKRRLHEIKIIIILAVLCVIFYGGAAILTVAAASGEDDTPVQAMYLGESVKAVTVETEEGTYHLEKEKVDWLSPEAENVNLDQVAIGNMTDLFTRAEPDRIIKDGSAYFGQFGLEDPAYRITVSGESEEKVYLIGSYNDILQQYYMAVEGEPAVYLISQRDAEYSMKTLLQLVGKPELSSIQSSYITALSFDGTAGHFDARKEGDIFIYEDGAETYEGDGYSALDIYYTLKNTDYSHCVVFDAAETEQAAYGLAEPDIHVTLTLEGEEEPYQIKIGRGEDGNYYLSSGAEHIIYQITEKEYQQLDEDTQISNLIE